MTAAVVAAAGMLAANEICTQHRTVSAMYATKFKISKPRNATSSPGPCLGYV
jgi:hypothetical protein